MSLTSSSTAARSADALVQTWPRIAAGRGVVGVWATSRVFRFLVLAAQLGLLLVVFRIYQVEEPVFLVLAAVTFAGFGVHYWLPERFKQPFWLALSMGGAYVLLEALTATLLLASGLLFFAILASPLSYRHRVWLVVGAAAVLMYGRATFGFGIPYAFWPVFGAIFMFRMMIYLYDLRHEAGRPSLRDYLSYFFLLPNYYFLLFPVVDFQTLRRSYGRRDIHVVAQQGILWMVRGTVHLLLYRLIYHLQPDTTGAVTSFGSLAAGMVMTYLLYLRVSGQFHIIVGMLHLFGYDLPETHRKYLLARSLTDFWRRINIYWKDFMVKLVYFPIYFRLRRAGDTRAKVIATAAVFTTTWLLHSYQWFWFRGEFLFTWPDFIFWAVLGALVTVNLLVERPAGQAPAGPTDWSRRLAGALQVAGTFVLITVLWSFWHATSVREWFDMVTYWNIG